jgi:hypothetical protein
MEISLVDNMFGFYPDCFYDANRFAWFLENCLQPEIRSIKDLKHFFTEIVNLLEPEDPNVEHMINYLYTWLYEKGFMMKAREIKSILKIIPKRIKLIDVKDIDHSFAKQRMIPKNLYYTYHCIDIDFPIERSYVSELTKQMIVNRQSLGSLIGYFLFSENFLQPTFNIFPDFCPVREKSELVENKILFYQKIFRRIFYHLRINFEINGNMGFRIPNSIFIQLPDEDRCDCYVLLLQLFPKFS